MPSLRIMVDLSVSNFITRPFAYFCNKFSYTLIIIFLTLLLFLFFANLHCHPPSYYYYYYYFMGYLIFTGPILSGLYSTSMFIPFLRNVSKFSINTYHEREFLYGQSVFNRDRLLEYLTRS